jgi:P-type Ca2+ transporter type 2C
MPASALDVQGNPWRWMQELTVIGLVGLQDPPRARALQAIAECRQAGIAVKMVTGDHQHTASAIARELGLHGRALSGAERDKLDAAQLAAVAAGDTATIAQRADGSLWQWDGGVGPRRLRMG